MLACCTPVNWPAGAAPTLLDINLGCCSRRINNRSLLRRKNTPTTSTFHSLLLRIGLNNNVHGMSLKYLSRYTHVPTFSPESYTVNFHESIGHEWSLHKIIYVITLPFSTLPCSDCRLIYNLHFREACL